jgi:HD-GYP domain-containing protein (c-di-GMP phosphodiesterase class II)
MKKIKIPICLNLSIEHESLLRKFTIIFFSLYLLPLAILFLVIHNSEISSKILLKDYEILIDKNFFDIFFTVFSTSSLVCFLWGHKTFTSLMDISQKAEEISKGNLGARIKDSGDKEIVELARSFNEITRKLEQNIERLKTSKRTLQEVLYRIGTGLSDITKNNMEIFLKLILDTTIGAIDARRGAIVMVNEENSSLFVQCSQGYSNESAQRVTRSNSEEALVIKNKTPIIIQRLDLNGDPFICVPLKYMDKAIGALTFSGRVGDDDFSQEDIYLLTNIASQTAIAIINERLHLDAELTYKQTVAALALAVEARDSYSRGHSDRVSKYSVLLAKHLGLDEKTIATIADAAELHDVGKIGIEDDILRKPEKLNNEEISVMRKHPVIGESIVKPIRSLTNLCDLIRHHHEFLDGSGYPDGLRGDEVAIGARILAIADAYDAMTTDRSYRKARSKEDALAELRKFSNIHYDKNLVEAFVEALLKENL